MCDMTVEYKFLNVSNNQELNSDLIKSPPRVIFGDMSYYYTIMMVDVDYPTMSNNIESPYLQWMIVNNFKNTYREENVVFPYYTPNPPSKTGYHRYVVCIYKQKNFIKAEEITNLNLERKKFKLEEFVKQFNLDLIKSKYFKVKKD